MAVQPGLHHTWSGTPKTGFLIMACHGSFFMLENSKGCLCVIRTISPGLNNWDRCLQHKQIDEKIYVGPKYINTFKSPGHTENANASRINKATITDELQKILMKSPTCKQAVGDCQQAVGEQSATAWQCYIKLASSSLLNMNKRLAHNDFGP